LIKVLTLCLFLLSGCASSQQEMINLPHSKNAWQIKDSNDVPDPDRISRSIVIFHRMWKEKFGDRRGQVKESLDNLMIEWSTEEKVLLNAGRDNQGRLVKRGRAKGMTLGPTYIWLRTTQYKRVFATSLIHELVHVALWAQECKGGDPDHEGDKYVCWTKEHTKFIVYLNKILAKLDI